MRDRVPTFAAAFCFAGTLLACALAADSPPPGSVAAAPDLGRRAGGVDWPRFLGPTGEGKSPEKIRTQWPREGLEVRWFKTVGEGYGAPSVAGGRLFFFDRLGEKARLMAWHAETGEELWRSEYPTSYEDYYDYSVGPRTTPVIDGESVYAFGVEGLLRAHHVADGRLLWEVDTAARFGVVQNFFGVGSTPLIEGDLLIVVVGGSPPGSPAIHSGEVRGNGTGIVAFDKRTGEVRYALTDELASYSSPVVATIGARRWGFVFTRGGLVGFEPRRGELDFFFPWRANNLESVNAATPVVVGDTVFVTETYGPGGALLKVRPGGYDVVWRDPPRGKAMECHWSTPIHLDGYLYGSSGRHTGNAELRAVDHVTGKVAWSEPGLGRATLTYADGHFFVLAEYGRLLLIRANPRRFEQVAEMDLGDAASNAGTAAAGDESNAKTPVAAGAAERPLLRYPAWNAPVLSHGLLYLRGKDQLVCLDVAPAAR